MAKHTFIRYGLSGVVYTLLGAGIFWLVYPAGPFLALGIAEVSCHVVMYLSLRHFVFPIGHGFHVSVPRYIATEIPTTITNVLLVVIFRILAGRTSLTLLIALFSVSVEFLWNRFVYKQRRRPVQTD